ncbi:MAG TPA: hypothetical protein VIC81_00950, partial [Acidimicrobiales bacterium]
GLGLIFAPTFASATAGVMVSDAGAASALVNTTQQIGGSMGIALLNTIAVQVTNRALAHPHPGLTNQVTRATLHGNAVAFWWAAGIFAVGAVITLFTLESGAADASDAPVVLV